MNSGSGWPHQGGPAQHLVVVHPRQQRAVDEDAPQRRARSRYPDQLAFVEAQLIGALDDREVVARNSPVRRPLVYKYAPDVEPRACRRPGVASVYETGGGPQCD